MLYGKWSVFCNKILPIYKKNIKDPKSRDLLEKLISDISLKEGKVKIQPQYKFMKTMALQIKLSFFLYHSNYSISLFIDTKHTLYAYLINSVLVTTCKTYIYDKSINKKRLIKSSIEDSQNKFIVNIKSLSVLNTEIDEIEKSCKITSQQLQPLIIAVGEDIMNIELFYVYFKPILYRFTNFIKALDCLFKVYQVFNFKYPKENIMTMTFIQQYFYEIILQEDYQNAKIFSLQKDLNNLDL